MPRAFMNREGEDGPKNRVNISVTYELLARMVELFEIDGKENSGVQVMGVIDDPVHERIIIRTVPYEGDILTYEGAEVPTAELKYRG